MCMIKLELHIQSTTGILKSPKGYVVVISMWPKCDESLLLTRSKKLYGSLLVYSVVIIKCLNCSLTIVLNI